MLSPQSCHFGPVMIWAGQELGETTKGCLEDPEDAPSDYESIRLSGHYEAPQKWCCLGL